MTNCSFIRRLNRQKWKCLFYLTENTTAPLISHKPELWPSIAQSQHLVRRVQARNRTHHLKHSPNLIYSWNPQLNNWSVVVSVSHVAFSGFITQGFDKSFYRGRGHFVTRTVLEHLDNLSIINCYGRTIWCYSLNIRVVIGRRLIAN